MADSSRSNDDTVPGSTYRTLLQFALLGTELGETQRAATIARALCELRPDLPQAGIVLAMNDFCSENMDRGIHELQSTLDRFPDSQLAKAILAVCLHVAGRSGWRALLEEVIEDGRDEYAIGLACSILGRPNGTADEPDTSPATAFPSHAMWA